MEYGCKKKIVHTALSVFSNERSLSFYCFGIYACRIFKIYANKLILCKTDLLVESVVLAGNILRLVNIYNTRNDKLLCFKLLIWDDKLYYIFIIIMSKIIVIIKVP